MKIYLPEKNYIHRGRKECVFTFRALCNNLIIIFKHRSRGICSTCLESLINFQIFENEKVERMTCMRRTTTVDDFEWASLEAHKYRSSQLLASLPQHSLRSCARPLLKVGSQLAVTDSHLRHDM